MRGTPFLVAVAAAVAVLFSLRDAHAEEDAAESEVPVQAADHLGTLRYALVVGINDYADADIPDLRHRESNARGVFSVLMDAQTGGVPTANVQALLGADATAAKIREALGSFRDLPREATVFVYFAGHGAKKGEDAYWVAQDSKADDVPATAIGAAEIGRLLGEVPAERILLLMDFCHAEGLVGKGAAQASHADVLASYHGKGYATLGAVGSEEHSIVAQEVERSVFTHHLIEGLSGEAEEDADGVVALSELSSYVRRRGRAEARKRRGLERPVVDLEGVPEPSRFLLTIEQEGFKECLLEDEGAEIRRRARLTTLSTLHGEGHVTTEQDRVGRYLLGVLREGLAPHELEQRTMFIDLVEGRLGPEHLADALTAIRRSDRRTLVVPDEFESIQAAIDDARAGDTVFVKGGQYDEHVVFKTGLCLRGEGREQTVVHMVPGQMEALLAEDCAWGVIERLQFDGSGGTAIGDWSPDGIHLKNSSVRVVDCLGHNCLGGGMHASGAGCSPYVAESTFERNGMDGVCFRETAGGMIVDCISRFNGAVGVQVRKSRGATTVQACLCEFNEHAGIGICGGSTAIVKENECQHNKGHGILLWDKGTSVSFEDNTCSRNAIFGIYVVQRAAAVANGNDCSRNKEGGIVVSGFETRATVVGNICLDNNLSETGVRAGILLLDGAHGEVTSNTCDGNTFGILVKGSGASGRLRDNKCRRNKTSGIEFSGAGPGLAAGNQCDENQYGITVSTTEATLEDNTLLRNTAHGIFICTRAAGTATGNRCAENEQDGIHVTGMGTSAELQKNTCATNRSHGIQFAGGASGLADGNDCSENRGFGIVAFGGSTRPTFRHNRCTNNVRAGIGKERGAAPIIESSNVQSGNGG